MRALLFVYLWWQLWLIQYQYGGPVTAMLAWKKGYWNLISIIVYLWWLTLHWLSTHMVLVSQSCHDSLNRRDIEMRAVTGPPYWYWIRHQRYLMVTNSHWTSITLSWLDEQYQYGGPADCHVSTERRDIEMRAQLSRLSLVTTNIDSVPIWRSSDCHVSLKEGILKWELYCSSISGDNFDWFSTNMEVQWLPC